MNSIELQNVPALETAQEPVEEGQKLEEVEVLSSIQLALVGGGYGSVSFY